MDNLHPNIQSSYFSICDVRHFLPQIFVNRLVRLCKATASEVRQLIFLFDLAMRKSVSSTNEPSFVMTLPAR